GKRGESGTPEDPARAKVWLSIAEGWNVVGFENEYVSTTEVSRTTLAAHPWSLGGGGAQELRERIERVASRRLADQNVDIGRTMHTGLDDAFYVPACIATRLGNTLPLVRGEDVRDWRIVCEEHVIAPYDLESWRALDEAALAPSAAAYLFRNKTM